MAKQPVRKLINNPDDLISDLIEGMVSAHPHLLKTEGQTGRAIVAVNGPREGKVGIVIGGGSGHEPAFAGYVGRGLADAAPLGNIFASPSPSQIMDAAFAADGGAGVLFLYGNYTGDVMNFDMAAEQLADHGITARSFVVTDDIASAPKEKAHERRGIAGDFFVFKVAGAAADLGLTFEDIESAAKEANANTLTMGVALSACSMPQTGKANFHIPSGEMEIGMGIHGEPGIDRVPVETADAVADRLLEPILSELGLAPGNEVAVLVNGLGSTTLLELYLLHRRVSQILDAKKVVIHKSWVGEYCTSLEMAGASVTLMRLTPELKRFLDHPCETPALQVGAALGSVERSPMRTRRIQGTRTPAQSSNVELETSGIVTPELFRNMLSAAGAEVIAARDRLCELDGAIGDGDHGVTMEIGWKAAFEAIDAANRDETISETCQRIAERFLEAVGASAGPLYASGFQRAGHRVADRLNLDTSALVSWLEGMAEGIASRGGAEEGDKTMLDAWKPAAVAARGCADNDEHILECMKAAASAADAGAESTKEMQSAIGRSKKLGQRSIGHVDPGAASAGILIKGIADYLRASLSDEKND